MNQYLDIAVGLGSNLLDRLKMIQEAANILASEFLEDAKGSSIYESEPWGRVKDQPHFLNAVVRGKCEWKPPAIVNYLKNLERQLGRLPGPKLGPRIIDLDLLVFGNLTWNSDGVTVPHPHLQERDFVLLPLMEVWPDWVDPRLNKTIDVLWSEFLKTGHSTARVSAPHLLNTAIL